MVLGEGILFFLTPLLLNFLICTYFNYPIFHYNFLFACNFNNLHSCNLLVLINLELERKVRLLFQR
jgi:hypothetical protein